MHESTLPKSEKIIHRMGKILKKIIYTIRVQCPECKNSYSSTIKDKNPIKKWAKD
jgi:hypothetical protein